MQCVGWVQTLVLSKNAMKQKQNETKGTKDQQ